MADVKLPSEASKVELDVAADLSFVSLAGGHLLQWIQFYRLANRFVHYAAVVVVVMMMNKRKLIKTN